MGTSACTFVRSKFLCYTHYDSHPFKLGEALSSIRTTWKDILTTCKEHQIYTIDAKYWVKDPTFVYNCFTEQYKKERPELLNPQLIDQFKNGNKEVIEEYFEECLVDWPNEPYTIYYSATDDYQYNHYYDQVFIRLRFTNFPWVPIDELGPFYDDERILENILFDMLGVIESSEINGDLLHKLELDGAISSGRLFILACKKATELMPEDPNNWWNYGKSLELKGNLDLAIKMYEKAVELTPNNPIIWRLLGNVYLKDFKVEESKFCLRKSYENLYRLKSFNKVEKERQQLILILDKLNDQKFLDDFYNSLIKLYCSLELDLKEHQKRKIWILLAEIYYKSNNIFLSKQEFKKEITFILNQIDVESTYWYYLFQNNRKNLAKKVEELKDYSIVDFISKEFADAIRELYLKYQKDPYLNFLYGQELFHQGKTEEGLNLIRKTIAIYKDKIKALDVNRDPLDPKLPIEQIKSDLIHFLKENNLEEYFQQL